MMCECVCVHSVVWFRCTLLSRLATSLLPRMVSLFCPPPTSIIIIRDATDTMQRCLCDVSRVTTTKLCVTVRASAGWRSTI